MLLQTKKVISTSISTWTHSQNLAAEEVAYLKIPSDGWSHKKSQRSSQSVQELREKISSEFPIGKGATGERILGLEESKTNKKEQNCENQSKGSEHES